MLRCCSAAPPLQVVKTTSTFDHASTATPSGTPMQVDSQAGEPVPQAAAGGTTGAAAGTDAKPSSSSSSPFSALLEVLSSELLNPSAGAVVRRSVQAALGLLAARRGSEVSELLEGNHGPLLSALLSRQLRSRHVEQQVGTVQRAALTSLNPVSF